MAQYKRKNIQNNAIGADQIALDNNKYLKADNFAKDGYVNILRVKEDNTVEIPALDAEVVALELADAANLQSAKDYTDAQIAAIPPVDLSAYETIANVDSKDAATLQAAKDYTDAEIAAIPSVDLSAYETIVNVDSKDAATLQSAKDYTDAEIAAIPPVDLSAYETIVNVDSKDAATLAAANLYTDNAIAAIPPVDLSGIQSDLDDVEVLANANAAAIDDVEVLANANAADIDALQAEMLLKESIVNVDSKDAATLQAAKDYTDAEIATIPPVDLSAYETIVNVDSKDAATLQAAKDYTDAEIAALSTVDPSNYYNKTEVDSKDAATLAAANLYTDNAIAAIPPVDLSAIEADIDQLQLDVDAVELAVGQAQLEVDAVELRVGALETSMTQAQSDITGINERLTNVEIQVYDVIGQELSAAQGDISTLFAQTGALDGRISTVEQDLAQEILNRGDADSSIQQTIASLGASLSNEIQGRNDADAGIIVSLNQETLDRQNADSALDVRVTALEGLVTNVATHTGNFNASPYKIHLVSGEAIVKLPAPGLDKIVTIKKTGSDLVTLEPHQTESIEGSPANYLLTSTRQSATLVSDGTDWFII